MGKKFQSVVYILSIIDFIDQRNTGIRGVIKPKNIDDLINKISEHFNLFTKDAKTIIENKYLNLAGKTIYITESYLI